MTIESFNKNPNLNSDSFDLKMVSFPPDHYASISSGDFLRAFERKNGMITKVL